MKLANENRVLHCACEIDSLNSHNMPELGFDMAYLVRYLKLVGGESVLDTVNHPSWRRRPHGDLL